MNAKKLNKLIEEENVKWPEKLKQVPEESWPTSKPKSLIEVWRSRGFLVQIYQEVNVKRMSVCRTAVKTDGKWAEEITWVELQELKSQCGYGKKTATEVYPPDSDVVNVANMRHLWILDEPPHYMWKG